MMSPAQFDQNYKMKMKSVEQSRGYSDGRIAQSGMVFSSKKLP